MHARADTKGRAVRVMRYRIITRAVSARHPGPGEALPSPHDALVPHQNREGEMEGPDSGGSGLRYDTINPGSVLTRAKSAAGRRGSRAAGVT